MIFKFKGREVEVDISGNYEEPMVERGNYIDGAMEDLTDQELDEVCEENMGEISIQLMEDGIARAYDRAKDLRKYGH